MRKFEVIVPVSGVEFVKTTIPATAGEHLVSVRDQEPDFADQTIVVSDDLGRWAYKDWPTEEEGVCFFVEGDVLIGIIHLRLQ